MTIKPRKIIINGVELTAHPDGSVERQFYGRMRRDFGTKGKRGYMQLGVGGKTTLVHRIIARAYLLDWDDSLTVDHIDGKKTNNDLANLRMFNASEQQRAFRSKPKNCTSTYRGVHLNHRGKWIAIIKFDGKSHYIGTFQCEEDAALAYNVAATLAGFKPQSLNLI